MKTPSKNKSELETPCLVLDMDVLESNLCTMQATVERAGKQLRPHIKTHKCSALAHKQIEAGAIGLCVAKVSEAEVLVRAGLDNILITGPLATTAKVARLVALLPEAPTLMVVVDHPGNIALLDAALAERGLSMDVLLDLDVGLKRTGVRPTEALALAGQIDACSTLRLTGIQAYAGHVQHIRSYNKRKQASHQCLEQAVELFKTLREDRPSCTIFSASGTGTFDIDLAIPEITELQTGSYTCMDTEYLTIGSVDNNTRFMDFEPALRLLSTVVSANQEDFVTVDAGLKSLYKDGGTPRVFTPEYASLEYDWFGDEYGRISRTDKTELPALGTVLELITSHCDPTINLFNHFVLTRGGRVTGVWPIDLRGCSQ